MTITSIDVLKILAAVIALAIAIIGHEIMHGWVAHKLGDDTAKNAGRLSLNPLVHIDLVGTIIVPLTLYFLPMLLGGESGILFGWAKPVPVNMRTVIHNKGYNGAMQVDLAGIVYNFVLAAFSSVILFSMHMPTTLDSLGYIFIYLIMYQLLIINVVLGVFNALPIPQLDGGNFIIHLSLKYKLDSIAKMFYKYEPYGMVFVLIILITPLKDYLLILPVSIILKLLT
ncbi:FIG004556: membrane metalloprotease [hydrothermal vent metagenome]|uniref:FIG004556: membrane metalloprotease n=1 Tax=hydrothermal vent metagenome TaxID=652676 RepID=A0A1W1D4N4_9ZZZZ